MQVPSALVAAAAATATASMDEAATVAAPAGADTADGPTGPQLVGSLVGMAAVGTVLWSEFVLKETGESGSTGQGGMSRSWRLDCVHGPADRRLDGKGSSTYME